jgi:hypothetical protein
VNDVLRPLALPHVRIAAPSRLVHPGTKQPGRAPPASLRSRSVHANPGPLAPRYGSQSLGKQPCGSPRACPLVCYRKTTGGECTLFS